MKHLRSITGLLALFLMAGCAQLRPSETPLGVQADAPIIRIGVVPSATTITLGSEGPYRLTDKKTGEVLLSGEGNTLTVALGGDAEVESFYRLQLACSGDPAPLVARAEEGGYETFLEPVPTANCTRIFIGAFDPPPASTYSARVAFKNEAVARGVAPSDAFWKVVTTADGTSEYIVMHGGEEITSPNPVVLGSEEGIVTIGGAPYRGLAEVATNSGGTLAGINEVPIDSYLYGVVPRELPPVPYGELEVQKAQAVAARTYALANLGKRRADGYDLLPTTSDQVYGGVAAEHPVSTRAVNETSGLAVMYGGEYASTLFHSTSGGFTANNEDVYNADPIPYLRGVVDAPRGRAAEHAPSMALFKRHANPASLRAKKAGDYEADWSKYHRWVFEWSEAEISRVVSAFAGEDVGKVLAINEVARADSGRFLTLEFVTERGSYYEHKDRIRLALQYVDQSGTLRPLLSTLFFIEPAKDKTTGELGFKAWGGGWGHGVGMSQTGAVGMAEKRATYDEILKYYYRGVRLEARY